MEKIIILQYFEEVELEEEYARYDGYYYRVSEAITLVILGSICGLRNTKQIWQWATNDKIREFLKEKFQICRVPSYYWLLCLLKMVKPESMNKCFNTWVMSMIPKEKGQTISLDGKTVRSTEKMESYTSPLHIVSAQLGELGLTYAQKAVEGKSNEIPAVQKLLEELDINGCIVVADALNCQKETAKVVVEGKGDYLLDVKGNQGTLKKDIEEYVQDEELQKGMDVCSKTEKNRDRVETRTAYSSTDIDWMHEKPDWANLQCIGAIHTEFETSKGKTSEWHYYISSRPLTAEQLLKHARLEWSVESMHWLLDVHFAEDYCRIENRNVQQSLNIVRKIALNLIKLYKQGTSSKLPLSNIMFNCLIDPSMMMRILEVGA